MINENKDKTGMYILTSVYVLIVVTFVFAIYLISSSLKTTFTHEEELTYVNSEIINNSTPVVSTKDEVRIGKPYNSDGVTIAKSFYNYKDETEKQQKSIIYYENTYIQNSGVDYVKDKSFEVISILDGTVIEITDDELLGKTIKIKHSNDLISVYQSISDVVIKLNDKVTKGQKLGMSSNNTINKDLGNHLHFELSYQGKMVDPETYYNKELKDL